MDETCGNVLSNSAMNKIKFKFLDIPIIRSCNLSCGGCLTFSDNKKIKGLVDVEESRAWMQYWSQRLDPEIITVFGGEPLLHPNFVEWYKLIREYWPAITPRVNTNGYYLDRLFDRVEDFFTEELTPRLIISIQTETEPYLSLVKQHIATLKQRIVEHYAKKYPEQEVKWTIWLDEPELNKQWWRLDVGNRSIPMWITVTEQFNAHWQAHYQGSGETLLPYYDYNDQYSASNHRLCQSAPFVNLYQGRIYKCPTIAVLEHTLTTHGIQDQPEWHDYLHKYQSLDMNSTDEEIAAWFTTQPTPQNVCNMCGFSGPNSSGGHINRHELKTGWKIKPVTIVPGA